MAAKQKGSRKLGRNKNTCAAYKTGQRWEFNKARRIIRHLRKHPNNQDAWKALIRLEAVLYSAHRSKLKLAEVMKLRPQE